MADLREARGKGAPLGVQILLISCNFWENLCWRSPLGSWRPLLGEILDPPLRCHYQWNPVQSHEVPCSEGGRGQLQWSHVTGCKVYLLLQVMLAAISYINSMHLIFLLLTRDWLRNTHITVKPNESWVIGHTEPLPPCGQMTNRQTYPKTLPSRNFVRWRAVINVKTNIDAKNNHQCYLGTTINEC